MSSPISDPTSSGALQPYRSAPREAAAHAMADPAVSHTAVARTAGASSALSHSAVSQDAMDHGAVVEAPHGGAVVSYNPDAPSEEWGWHGHWSDFAPRGRRALLWLGVFGLLLLTWGNHVSHVEDYFLVISALLMAGWIVAGERAQKRKRRIRP